MVISLTCPSHPYRLNRCRLSWEEVTRRLHMRSQPSLPRQSCPTCKSSRLRTLKVQFGSRVTASIGAPEIHPHAQFVRTSLKRTESMSVLGARSLLIADAWALSRLSALKLSMGIVSGPPLHDARQACCTHTASTWAARPSSKRVRTSCLPLTWMVSSKVFRMISRNMQPCCGKLKVRFNLMPHQQVHANRLSRIQRVYPRS